DLGGNAEPVQTQTLKIDALAPTAQITQPATGSHLLPGDVTVKVDAADGTGSGITDVEFYVDGDWAGFSKSKSSPYDFTIPGASLSLGNHRVKAVVTDAIGNQIVTPNVNFTLKDGLPNTAIACDGGACPNGFVKGPVQVTLSATHGGGGMGATRYTLDGSDPTAGSTLYSGP